MFDRVEEEKVLIINEGTQLKFFECDAPFFSNLSLYHDDQEITACSFKPQEKKMIKQSMDSYPALIQTLKEINKEVESKNLSLFINLVEEYKNDKVRPGPNRSR